jgi:hypothetical protein
MLKHESGLQALKEGKPVALTYQEPGHGVMSFQVLLEDKSRISSRVGVSDLRNKLEKAGISLADIVFLETEETKRFCAAEATRSFTTAQRTELLGVLNNG